MAENNYMDAHGFNENSGLRASDADRDAAASVVNNALAEGRLTADEHSERLDAIYSAKTRSELVPLLADLPGQRTAAPATATAGHGARSGRGSRIVAIFSGASRKGVWHPEPVTEILAVFGGAELDFREAVLPGNEIVVRATTVLGGVEITVPPEMRVIDNGVAILGGIEIHGGGGPAGSDAPVLRLEGVCVLGGVEVRRKERRGVKSAKSRIGYRDDLVLENVLGQALERRHEMRHQIRERRREWRDQFREERREWHGRGWHGSDDEE
jgi:DUF1707 SHOCT-like domain/Cell wall-active antibiotics response LiaF, C-terminal